MSRACAERLFHAPPLPLQRTLASHMNYPYYRTWCELARYYLTGIPFGADSSSDVSSSGSSSGGSSNSGSSIARLTAMCGVNGWCMPRCAVLFVFGRESGKRRVFWHTDMW
jgi:hypothetical protein